MTTSAHLKVFQRCIRKAVADEFLVPKLGRSWGHVVHGFERVALGWCLDGVEDGDHNGTQGVVVWSERVEAGFVDHFCGGDAGVVGPAWFGEEKFGMYGREEKKEDGKDAEVDGDGEGSHD